jgi:uncharacterized protein
MRRALPVVLLLALFAPPLAAVPLWSVTDASGESTVLLLGSVHLLRPEDQPLPEAVHDAYRRAGRVVMELHPEALAPEAAQAALARIGIQSPGNSALEVLGPEWPRAEAQAAEAGLMLEAVAMFEPWFAALALYNGVLAASGFDPALGVDQQVASWVARDDKPVAGLETLDEQLRLFKTLPPELQRDMLLKTIEELPTMGADSVALVGHWRDGDVAALAARLEADFREHPELRMQIVGRRNHAWMSAIEPLFEGGGTSLVVVGALHLVGPEGLPALLEQRGYVVRPLAVTDLPPDVIATAR